MSSDDDCPLPIEDYALIGDCLTAALVGRNGSIDWLCWPRFDSDACFAALLGSPRHGRWLIAPTDPVRNVSRRYRGDTMVLETVFETTTGSVALVDFMPTGRENSSVVRRIEGRRGNVPMRMDLALRFEYGRVKPWLTPIGDGSGIDATVGPNRVQLHTHLGLDGSGDAITSAFTAGEGETAEFSLTWGPSHLPAAPPFDTTAALSETDAFWREWSGRCGYKGGWRDQVMRSLLTLKTLTYEPTGAIVAAPTTSLPEQLGGSRNWDYRFCWLRDATLTLLALMSAGYFDEAKAWRDWLRRAVVGDPDDLQIMYGIGGERRLLEWSPDWLPGYQGASPVRIGNAASAQVQLDVFGEVLGGLSIARHHKLADPADGWRELVQFVNRLEELWRHPDQGIWEMRSEPRHFTHSKFMVWAALDMAIEDAETFRLEAPLERWRRARDEIHAEICAKGFDRDRNCFTQSFGRPALDASLLLMARTGFLPADDPRVVGTVKAIEGELLTEGFVQRYRTNGDCDGLPAGEGVFLPCSFWLASMYALQGRQADARALFERAAGVANDVGLLAEEYDPRTKRQIGNFPQAFSHLSLIGAALTLEGSGFAPHRGAAGRRKPG